MESSNVSSKGQIVIPAKIREHYKIKAGTKVFFLEQDGNIILKPLTDEYINLLQGSWQTKGEALKLLLSEKESERER